MSAGAQKLVEKGQYDKAIKEYLRIVAEDDRDVRIWLKIGDLYAKIGRKSEAAETYQRVAQFYSDQGFYLKAVAVYKQILKIDPQLVDVNHRLAELYKQLGLLSDAMQQYEQVAAAHQRDGRTRDTIVALKQIVELDPETVANRIKLAELCSHEGMVREAVDEFARAAEQLRQSGRVDDFMKVAERLLFHTPDNRPVMKELAALYVDKGDPRRALPKLQVCFKADPRDVEVLAQLARAFQALEQRQKSVSVLKELARILGENGDLRGRDATWRKILQLAPGDPDVEAALAAPGRTRAASTPRVEWAGSTVASTAALQRESSSVGRHPVTVSASGHVETLRDEPPFDEFDGPSRARGFDELVDEATQPPRRPPPPFRREVARGEPARAEAAPRRELPRAESARAEAAPRREVLRAESARVEPARPEPSRAELLRQEAAPRREMPHNESSPRRELSRPELLSRREPATAGFAAVRGEESPPPLDVGNDEAIARILNETDVYIKYNLHAKAVEHLQRAFERDPHHQAAREKLKALYLILGRREEAILELWALAEQAEPGRKRRYLREILEIDPAHARAAALLGEKLPSPSLAVPTAARSVGSGPVGSGRVGSGPVGSGRVGSGPVAAGSELVNVDELEELGEEDFEVAEPSNVVLPERVAALGATAHARAARRGGEAARGKGEAARAFDPERNEIDEDELIPVVVETLKPRGERRGPEASSWREGPSPVDPASDARTRYDERVDARALLEMVAALDEDPTLGPGRERDVPDATLPGAGGAAGPTDLGDTRLDLGGGPGQGDTNLDLGAGLGDTSLDLGGRPGLGDTNLDLGGRPGFGDTNLDLGGRPGLGDTNLDLGGRAGQGDTSLDLGGPVRASARPDARLATAAAAPEARGAAPEVGRGDSRSDGIRLGSLGGEGSLEDDLDEADFFMQQALYDEARHILDGLLRRYPHHPLVSAKLRDLEAMEGAAGPESAPLTVDASGAIASTGRVGTGRSGAGRVGTGRAGTGHGDEAARSDVTATGVSDVPAALGRRGVIEKGVTAEDFETHYDLGIAYKEMGLLDDAVAEFRIVMKDPTREVQCHLMIGLCFLEKGLQTDAIGQFKKGLYVDGITDREALSLYFELGQAYEMLSDPREALYYYEKVSKRDANFRDVAQRVEALRGGSPSPSPLPTTGSGDELDAAFASLLANRSGDR